MTHSPAAVSAAILTGGRARRFGGRDKSRLVIGGRTIIIRQVEILQRVAQEIFLAGGDPDRGRDVGLPVVGDVVSGAGAMAGLLTALERAAHPRVIVLACDLPFVTDELLHRLVDAASHADAAWVRSARGVEPLVACYRRDVRATIRAEILAGRLALTGLRSVLNIAMIDVSAADAEAWLVNVNTPAEYDRIR